MDDLKDLFIAIWLHENYESRSKEFGWDTQNKCKVKFDDLPIENKKVILSIARDINYNLANNKEQGIEQGKKEGAIVELKIIIKNISINSFDVKCYCRERIKKLRGLKEWKK